jgi:predicted enzyme related to lactoylglutathione lyase
MLGGWQTWRRGLEGPVDVPGVGRIAMIKDPAGAVVGLITPAQQG